MSGRLDRKSLETLVRKGEIDTVLTVFPDGLSRLMGKRLTARHFLEHALDDGLLQGGRDGRHFQPLHQAHERLHHARHGDPEVSEHV